ncbi:MAG: ATP-grasp domain-containing protein [Proteobacteria bacterium]|nr:ATP-grasp domain-containing protein [Pseudomonadota bacterium]
MKILITGAGGAAAVSVWKSLNKEHELYMADIDPVAAGLYLVPSDRRMIIPPGKSPDFLNHLLKICQEKQIEILIPTVDVELLTIAENREKFEALGTKVPISSAKTLKTCRDKHELLLSCQNTHLAPKSSLLNKETNLDSIDYPCFAKPRNGAGGTGAMVIHNQQELETLPKDDSYLIQELLPGEEYSVDVYIKSDGKAIAAIPRLRMKIDSGIAVACRTENNSELVKLALEVAKLANITYVANIQFKADKKGHFKLLEINPRFPGTLPLTIEAGVDIPKLLIQDVKGELHQNTMLPFKEIMVVRYWTEQFLEINEWKTLCQN